MKEKIIRNVIDLNDSCFDLSFEGFEFVFLHTEVQTLALAIDLDKIYNLHLQRNDDLLIEKNTLWPYYSYYQPITHHTYHLVEKPQLPPDIDPVPQWNPTDRLIIIYGDDAEAAAQKIVDDFSSPQSDSDIATRSKLLHLYQQSLSTATRYTFSDNDIAKANIRQRRPTGKTTSLATLIAHILDAIDLSESLRKAKQKSPTEAELLVDQLIHPTKD